MNYIRKVYMLWAQHSEWTRMAFSSIIFRTPDEEEVINRLLKNPMDFAMLLRIFYGDKIGFRFGKLLTEHLQLAADLVRATMTGDNSKAEAIDRRLYENADEISYLLGSINPYWYYKDWRRMFYSHLDLAKMMASQMINGRYRESIDTYDIFEKEVWIMADMMARGLLKQFPYILCNNGK